MQKDRQLNAPPATSIRVLLVENHQVVVWGLEKLIEAARPEIMMVGSASNATDALRLVQQTRPDVILLSLDMGDQILALIPQLMKKGQVRVVAMAGANGTDVCDKAVLSGARGLLRRQDPIDVIIKAIRKVHAGELWLDRAMTGRLFRVLAADSLPDPDAAKIAALTKRERIVIAALASVASARHRKIADLLRMSEHTLRNHLSSIYGKLELAGHFELYLYAKSHGLDKQSAD
jgi:DNA-binding NarL/FixJ family response regulator